MSELSVFIKRQMMERNLKSNQLAKLSGVSTSEISRILSGERKTPNPQIIRKMAPILRVPFAELLDIAYPPKKTTKRAEKAEIEPIAKEIAEFAIREVITKYLPFKKDYIDVIGFANTDNLGSKLPQETSVKYIPSVENAGFAVIVKGNKLLERNIKENDIVYIEKLEQPVDGEIILIECEEQYYLRIYDEKGNIFTDGSGNLFECKQPKVLGKIIGLLRELKR